MRRRPAVVRVPTHGVPHVDVALASPVVALRKGLPIREHVAFPDVGTLSKAIIIQPGSPVVDVARVELPVGCSGRRRERETNILNYLNCLYLVTCHASPLPACFDVKVM